MLLSVIVPVYNTERYLAGCLDSILGQTLKDMEIICVDDGSEDGSPEILKSYAVRDHRIRVIQKENGGLVSARKAGVRVAEGKYIGYVDSDDWIEPEMYERLCGYAQKYQADLVSSGYIMEGNYVSEHYDGIPEGLYDGKQMDYLRENAIYHTASKDVGVRGSLCCKVFLAEKFRPVQFGIPEEVSMSEDKLCVVSYLLESSRVYIAEEAFYHYLLHGESMVHTPDPQYLVKVDRVYRCLAGLYEHPAFTEGMRLQAELYVTELLYKGINSRLGFRNENLLWIDPLWMEEIPAGSRILLYGAGALGRKYYQQICNREGLFFAGCIDFGYETVKKETFAVENPEKWMTMEFDILVITIKNRHKAEEVHAKLCELGIETSKIRHFEQKELFWRFAEADGILGQ